MIALWRNKPNTPPREGYCTAHTLTSRYAALMQLGTHAQCATVNTMPDKAPQPQLQLTCWLANHMTQGGGQTHAAPRPAKPLSTQHKHWLLLSVLLHIHRCGPCCCCSRRSSYRCCCRWGGCGLHRLYLDPSSSSSGSSGGGCSRRSSSGS